MRNKKKLIFVACALALQGCSDPAERSSEYLDSAKSYYEKGNYDKAKLELRNALQIDDKLAEAYYYMALTNEKEQQWKEMFSSLTQTLKLNPKNDEARIKLAKLYLLAGNLDEASAEVDLLLKSSVVDNPNVIALNGAFLLKKGDAPSALAEAKKALAIEPSHIDSVGLIVGVYLEQKDYLAAEKQTNDAIAANPEEISFYLLRLQTHMRSKNIELMEQDYNEIIKKFPKKLEFSYALAKLYVNENKNTEALNLLKSTVESNNELVEPKLVLIDFLMQKDISSAESTIKQFIATNTSETDLYLKLASLYILQKRMDEAKEPLNWVVDHNGDDKKGIQAKSILAKFAVQEGDIEGAAEMVTDILSADNRNYDALLLKSRISLINGSYDDAITDLRGILRDYSKSDETMVLLGQTFLMKGSPELAEEHFRKALELNPGNFSAVMPVVSRMIKSKDIGRAEEILQKALEKQPNHEAGMQALAQVRLLKQDWSGTQKVADLISKHPKGQGFANYLGGKISQGQGLYKDAIEKYKLALLDTPTFSDALKSMLVCYEGLKQRDKMHAFIDEFIVKNPTLSYPLIYKSQLFGLGKKWDKAIDTLNKGISKWPKTYQFYESIAMIQLGNKETEKAINTLRSGLVEIPNSVQLGMALASIYEAQKDPDNALKVYETVVEKNPKVDIAVNNLVSLLLDQAPEKNAARAVDLSKRFETSKQPYFMDTYGWALLQNGKVKESIQVLDKVISNAPKIAVFHYHLGVAYHQSENNAEAVRFLERALELGKAQKGEFAEKDKAETLLKTLKTSAG